MPRTLVDLINQKIVPPVFIAFFTLTAPFLTVAGNPEKSFQTSFIWGNFFAWKFIAALFIWGLIWLWIPAKAFYGPTSNFGYTPKYQANGEIYYFTTMAAFGVITYLNPRIWVSTYENMGPIVGGLNIVALTLCLYLLIRAKLKKEERDPYLIKGKFPILFEFYRGMELHPRILGVDVKQLTNSRIACILWQLLPLIFFSAAYQTKGFDYGHFVNVLLQTIYIYKFYKWETGYFTTMDMTLDRTGYYLCWGTLVWVPAFYTFHSYIFVYYPPNCGPNLAAVILILGAASIWLNYEVDRQKELFLASKGKLMIWGEEAKTVKVSYITATGEERKSELLISGWWGVARKINYTFELAATFMWSVPGGLGLGVWPFLPNIFVAGLLVHRIFRDEKKCQAKYGKGWNEYCKNVPYRLVPYIF